MAGRMREARRRWKLPLAFCPGLSRGLGAGPLGLAGDVWGGGGLPVPHSDFLPGLLWLGRGGSGQRRDGGVGQPGRDPEAALPLPQGRAPPAVPLVPGEWAAPSRAAGSTALASAGEGEWSWGAQEAALGAGRGEWPFLPSGPCAAAWAHSCPTGTLRACRVRDRRVPGARPWGVFLQGKVFPKLRKRSPQGSSESTSSDKEDDEATDYVFRIIYPGTQSELGKRPWPSARGVNLFSWS